MSVPTGGAPSLLPILLPIGQGIYASFVGHFYEGEGDGDLFFSGPSPFQWGCDTVIIL